LLASTRPGRCFLKAATATMPKRILDGEAMWSSTKLSTVPEPFRVEYAWLYPLADCNGSFEITSLRAVANCVNVIRPALVPRKIEVILLEFVKAGLLFIWEENGKKYAHWTNSERPGRLPKPSDRFKYEKLAPPVPADKLAAFLACPSTAISPYYRPNSAANRAHGVGVGIGLGEGGGVGEGVGVGAQGDNRAILPGQNPAQNTAAKPAAASHSHSEKRSKPNGTHVLDPDESLRPAAERLKADLWKKFGKSGPKTPPPTSTKNT